MYTYDKEKLIRLCYGSVMKAFEGKVERMYFIIDGPTFLTRSMVDKCPYLHGVIHYNHVDIHPRLANEVTFRTCLYVGKNQVGKKLVFIEDDYFFLPHAGAEIDAALDEFELVTPYDHPAYYQEDGYTAGKERKLVGNTVWKDTTTTCLTFACTHAFLEREFTVMAEKYEFGVDAPMWLDIAQRTKIWAPEPSLATHMEAGFLAPGIDWRKKFSDGI